MSLVIDVPDSMKEVHKNGSKRTRKRKRLNTHNT
jgi:hypothetical protein